MNYSYGGRVDTDSNAITEIDEENRTATTKGYVNGEYVEFGSGGGGGDSLPVVKYSVDANVTSITCDTPFEDVLGLVENGNPFLLFVFYDGEGTDAVIFPQSVITNSYSVYFDVSLMGHEFRVMHDEESITIDPIIE